MARKRQGAGPNPRPRPRPVSRRPARPAQSPCSSSACTTSTARGGRSPGRARRRAPADRPSAVDPGLEDALNLVRDRSTAQGRPLVAPRRPRDSQHVDRFGLHPTHRPRTVARPRRSRDTSTPRRSTTSIGSPARPARSMSACCQGSAAGALAGQRWKTSPSSPSGTAPQGGEGLGDEVVRSAPSGVRRKATSPRAGQARSTRSPRRVRGDDEVTALASHPLGPRAPGAGRRHRPHPATHLLGRDAVRSGPWRNRVSRASSTSAARSPRWVTSGTSIAASRPMPASPVLFAGLSGVACGSG